MPLVSSPLTHVPPMAAMFRAFQQAQRLSRAPALCWVRTLGPALNSVRACPLPVLTDLPTCTPCRTRHRYENWLLS